MPKVSFLHKIFGTTLPGEGLHPKRAIVQRNRHRAKFYLHNNRFISHRVYDRGAAFGSDDFKVGAVSGSVAVAAF